MLESLVGSAIFHGFDKYDIVVALGEYHDVLIPLLGFLGNLPV